MRKLLIILVLGMFLLQGYSNDSAEPEKTQQEKEQQMLTEMQDDFFVESVSFDEDNKAFTIVSDYHVRAFTIAKRGEGLEMRNGNVISWENYVEHHMNSYFHGGDKSSPFSYGISDRLGEGYTVKEVTSCGKTVFIAKDGELIYDIINGYVN